jgi:L-gulonolactone oxidase
LIRFASPDGYGYLSPALGRPTGYISLITIARKGYRELFEAIENALYPLGGRPHWGKVHFLTREKAAALYGENYHLFCKAKRKLDPDHLFTNEYIDVLFHS